MVTMANLVSGQQESRWSRILTVTSCVTFFVTSCVAPFVASRVTPGRGAVDRLWGAWVRPGAARMGG